MRRGFSHFFDPRVRRATLQPHAQFLESVRSAVRENLDGSVR